MSKRLKLSIAGAAFLVSAVLFPFFWQGYIERRFSRDIYEVADVRQEQAALVFGARVYPNGRLSTMLRDRVETAVDLYHDGTVQRIVMSGGVYENGLSEPEAMRAYAISRGVPPEAIEIDNAGVRTYATCYNARNLLSLESAILVTQTFHLPRALFTCTGLGMDVVSVSADRRIYSPRSMQFSQSRELPATLVALFDVVLQRPPAQS